MRRSTKLIGSLALLLTAAGAANLAVANHEDAVADKDFRQFVAQSRSDQPQGGLASDWFDCLERRAAEASGAPARVVCKTWAADGMISELVALKIGDQHVPVIESRSEAAKTGRLVVDITGGPGGQPFYINPAMNDKLLEYLRGNGGTITGIDGQSTYSWFLGRGFTIASIGYWGTSFRTLNSPGEFELAVEDVRSAVDFYRAEKGAEPALILTSLGNHIALAALGKDRLERMEFLALVPMMDGLQHHLGRFAKETEKDRLAAEANGKLFGTWTFFNVYKETERGIEFDYVRMLPMDNFVPRFIGDADFAWSGVTPKNRCSQIVLGDKDPRTLGYLAANDDLPSFIAVFEAEHSLFDDAPQEMQAIFERYADCLAEQSS